MSMRMTLRPPIRAPPANLAAPAARSTVLINGLAVNRRRRDSAANNFIQECEERPMDFNMSDRQKEWLNRVQSFMHKHVRPAVPVYKQQDAEGQRWKVIPIVEELKKKAHAEGLWNMFMPPSSHEDGEIRSAFLMTEPAVASSDATNIETRIERDGDHYVINGRKWWSSGVGDPRCKIAIVMGKTDPSAARHQQQSQILVPLDAKGIQIEKLLPVFGFDAAPHGHAQVLMENVRVPAGNILLGEGRGFEIAQGRLGPGRIHHCMRTIGKAEEALEKMVKRLSSRTAFGKKIIEYSIWEQRIAEARIDIEMNRLLCLKAADMMDKVGNKTAQLEIAMIKVAAPNMALKIIDHAIQAFGAAGVSDDAGLARDYASMRTMRLADGPDEVHNRAIARLELRKYANAPTSH